MRKGDMLIYRKRGRKDLTLLGDESCLEHDGVCSQDPEILCIEVLV